MMKSDELLFRNLFERALKDWPKEIVFGKLIRYETSQFTIEGLGELSRKINYSYIDHPEEVIMRDLHSVVYICLHNLAEFSLKMSMEDLRSEKIQKEFETRMKESLEDPESLDWEEDDIQLVKDYFKVNYPSEMKVKNNKNRIH